MKFMRTIIQGTNPAFFNMALDEAISEAVRSKLSPPTLRLYQWDRPSLSIGYFQKISDINAAYCRVKGYPVVRRQTGGRAILHDKELTYSISASADSPLFRDSLYETYFHISNAMILGLKMNGIESEVSLKRKRNINHKNPACFKAVSYGEITVCGKKIIGSAQKRFSNGLLQHGSILLGFDAEKLCNVLSSGEAENFNDIGALRDYSPEISVSMLVNSLKDAFENTFKVKMISDNPTVFEMDLARELEDTKYSTDEWNLLR